MDFFPFLSFHVCYIVNMLCYYQCSTISRNYDNFVHSYWSMLITDVICIKWNQTAWIKSYSVKWILVSYDSGTTFLKWLLYAFYQFIPQGNQISHKNCYQLRTYKLDMCTLIIENQYTALSSSQGFSWHLKALMPITFSSPKAQPEVVYFLISNESPYFSDCKSKISASNSL